MLVLVLVLMSVNLERMPLASWRDSFRRVADLIVCNPGADDACQSGEFGADDACQSGEFGGDDVSFVVSLETAATLKVWRVWQRRCCDAA